MLNLGQVNIPVSRVKRRLDCSTTHILLTRPFISGVKPSHNPFHRRRVSRRGKKRYTMSVFRCTGLSSTTRSRMTMCNRRQGLHSRTWVYSTVLISSFLRFLYLIISLIGLLVNSPLVHNYVPSILLWKYESCGPLGRTFPFRRCDQNNTLPQGHACKTRFIITEHASHHIVLSLRQ